MSVQRIRSTIITYSLWFLVRNDMYRLPLERVRQEEQKGG